MLDVFVAGGIYRLKYSPMLTIAERLFYSLLLKTAGKVHEGKAC